MGGNALPTVKTRRIKAIEYYLLAQKVCSALARHFNARAEFIPSYREKETFGDLDVLLEQEKVLADTDTSSDRYSLLKEFVIAHFGATAFHVNGSVFSFDYRATPTSLEGFQVDLIVTPSCDFDASLNYFSYNDLGNLIGRIAHSMGLSYGHRGLIYNWREGTNLFRVITITQDTEKALKTLGYSYDRFLKGFNNLNEIFEYTTSSKYFNSDIYLLENRNHASRTRDKKRQTYHDFLQYIADPSNALKLPAYSFPEDKAVWLPELFNDYPNFKTDWDNAKSDLSIKKELKEYFNGHDISKWTGLTGHPLALFMEQLRKEWQDSSELLKFLRKEGSDGLRTHALALLKARPLDTKKIGP